LGDGTYIEFPKSPGMQPSGSLLAWYFDNYAALIIGDMVNRLVGQAVHVQRFDDMFEIGARQCGYYRRLTAPMVDQGHVLDDTSWITGAEPTAKNPAKTIGSELCLSHQVVSYLISGLSYKAAVMRYIITSYCAAKKPFSYIDFGGVMGS